MIIDTCKNCREECYCRHFCGHFKDSCPSCIAYKDSIKEGVYYGMCFYCLLDDNIIDPKFEWSNYDDIVSQVHDAYRIGYNDGHLEKDCKDKELETVYKDGYNAGKTTSNFEN